MPEAPPSQKVFFVAAAREPRFVYAPTNKMFLCQFFHSLVINKSLQALILLKWIPKWKWTFINSYPAEFNIECLFKKHLQIHLRNTGLSFHIILNIQSSVYFFYSSPSKYLEMSIVFSFAVQYPVIRTALLRFWMQMHKKNPPCNIKCFSE